MAGFIFAPKGGDAAARRLRRQAGAGELVQLATGVYLPADGVAPEEAARLHLPALVGYLFPDGVITDLTGVVIRVQRAAALVDQADHLQQLTTGRDTAAGQCDCSGG